MKAKPTILVVDNEPGFCMSLGDCLDTHGYELKLAYNRADAWTLLSARTPDLVVLGTILPRGDAFALHNSMRSTDLFKAIPIIVLDAPPEKQVLAGWRKHEGFCMDAEDYLVKPIEPESLMPRIAKLLDTATARVKVLIVDDHALIREGIHALLSPRPDMQVVGFAQNGKEAVTKVAELNPDVVLMDIRMPEMSGLEATKVICGQPHHAKILMLSQYDDADNVVASKAAGAWDLIPKQSASDRLVNAIRTAACAA